MADKAAASAVIFRPHFKTHQSLEVGEWFREEGVERITVSSAEMALKFADAGWQDITIAFPANIRETDTFNALSAKIDLNLMVDSPEATQVLADSLKNVCGIFIEIDCGYGRSGVAHTDFEKTDRIVDIIKSSDKLTFTGFLTHAGNTYHAGDKSDIIGIYDDSLTALQDLKNRYLNEFPDLIISVGDTPSCSIVDDLSGADEIRPGNFVYYDLMQYSAGICAINEIAVSVACPVTGIYPERNEIVIYGGAVHLSKEYLGDNDKYYGLLVQYTDKGWSSPVPDTKLISLSQEHGVIRTSSNFLKTLKIGDILGILPIHSCLTADLLQDHTLVV